MGMGRHGFVLLLKYIHENERIQMVWRQSSGIMYPFFYTCRNMQDFGQICIGVRGPPDGSPFQKIRKWRIEE